MSRRLGPSNAGKVAPTPPRYTCAYNPETESWEVFENGVPAEVSCGNEVVARATVQALNLQRAMLVTRLLRVEQPVGHYLN